MLCIPLFLCVSSSSYLRKEGFCGTTGWERIVYHYFHLKQGCHVQSGHSVRKKGDTLELKDATKRVYIKEFATELFGVFVVVEKKKKKPFLFVLGLNVALFFISVFMLADFDWGYNVRHFLLSFLHLFLFPVPLIFRCSSVCQVWLCCIPRCFPLYNIWQRKETQKKKKIIWLIFHCS